MPVKGTNNQRFPQDVTQTAEQMNAKKAENAERQETSADEGSVEEEESLDTEATPQSESQAPPAGDEDDNDKEEHSQREEPPPREVTTPANVEANEQVPMEDDKDVDIQQVEGAAAKTAEVDGEEDEDHHGNEGANDAEGREEAPPMKKKKMPSGEAVTTKSVTEDVGGELITIFIGGVKRGTQDHELEAFFVSNGVPVKNTRVIPNKSFTFAYADVTSEKMFKKAMELNHRDLNGSEIRLERGKNKAEGSASSGPSDSANIRTLFIKGISFNTTKEALQEKFGCKEVRMPMKNGRPGGFGYLEFEDEAGADVAMEEFEGTEIDGQKIFLDYIGDKSRNKKHKSLSGSQTLHIKGLTYHVTEADLKEKLGALEVRRPVKRGDPYSLAEFAYADFESEEAAKQAMEGNQGAVLKGATLTLHFAKNKKNDVGWEDQQYEKKTLHIRGLSWETTQERLQSFMGADSVRIPYDWETEQPKGFAYAEYNSEGEATEALNKLNATELDGYMLTIEYAKPRTNYGSPRGGYWGGYGGDFRGGRGGGGGGGGRGFSAGFGFGGRGFGRGGPGGRGGWRGRGGRGGGFRGGRGGGFRGRHPRY